MQGVELTHEVKTPKNKKVFQSEVRTRKQASLAHLERA
jgi:hypothetical protein